MNWAFHPSLVIIWLTILHIKNDICIVYLYFSSYKNEKEILFTFICLSCALLVNDIYVLFLLDFEGFITIFYYFCYYLD